MPRTMRPWRAPSAARMPISRVRRATVNDISEWMPVADSSSTMNETSHAPSQRPVRLRLAAADLRERLDIGQPDRRDRHRRRSCAGARRSASGSRTRTARLTACPPWAGAGDTSRTAPAAPATASRSPSTMPTTSYQSLSADAVDPRRSRCGCVDRSGCDRRTRGARTIGSRSATRPRLEVERREVAAGDHRSAEGGKEAVAKRARACSLRRPVAGPPVVVSTSI